LPYKHKREGGRQAGRKEGRKEGREKIKNERRDILKNF
jgi:predicted transposase YdaD